ncbi:MAG: lamin tail domain-containing protein [Planctomycetes bacterium]|jgi:hypothetical protein|nr:lamin tail domain-containing protein [Planctomycetota bacterium]
MTGPAKTLVFLGMGVLWGLMPAVGRLEAAPPLVLNEFMAANGGSLQDPQGEAEDWVEIRNTSSQIVDLAGMYLTDDLDVPRKWRFPTDAAQLTRIPAQGYLLVWLDEDTADAGLHASFALDAPGDRIALFDTDGATRIDTVAFKNQRGNVVYGRFPDGTGPWLFLTAPTPRAANAPAYEGAVADTKFSHDRGFYEAPFDVTITCATPGVTIYYTLDGSEPAALGARAPVGRLYSGPIRIGSTVCLRARAIKNGWLSTPIHTRTYLFLSDVITRTQGEVLARGYPDKWFGTQPGDYEMDPQVYNDPAYAALMDDALLAIPTLSLVTNKDNFFGTTNDPQTGGIYIYTGHSSTGGRDWERPVSVEFFTPDGSRQFQADCGIRIQGGESRNPPKCPKHSLGLRFRNEYGPGRLDFPLFEDSPVESFDSLQLRGFFNNAWTHWDANQRLRTQYIRDQWMHDSLHDMGNADAGRGLYAHLYINGIYWGLYLIQERPVAAHYAAYQGCDEDRIDAINGNRTPATDGTTQAWNELKGIVASRDWVRIQQAMDVDNFIDWTLLNLFAGNHDLKTDGNWRTAGGGPDRKPWRFYVWDGEQVLVNVDQTGTSPAADPTGLLSSLESIEEFRVRFGDRVHKHLFHGGALTAERNIARWTRRAGQIELAVVAESARWGDYRRDVHPWSSGPYLLYTRDAHWIPEKNRLLMDYFPRRTDLALAQFKSRGLYPSVNAPVFYVGGTAQHGGQVATRAPVSMQVTGGVIWYTLDGTDPRPALAGTRVLGEVRLVTEDAAKRVLVPTGPVDTAWRGGRTFNDSTWISGTGGVGYERSSGYEKLFKINVQSQMYNRNASCCIRIPFTIAATDLAGLSGMTLRIRCDDGFVAYLNGTEIARKNCAGEPAWNSLASTSTADADAVIAASFNVASHLGKLQQGQNLLAIHGLNDSVTSSDFLISAELVGTKSSSGAGAGGAASMAARYAAPVILTQSACVKARALVGSTWSAVNEAVFAVGPVAAGLRITELMYHPLDTGNPNDPNTEFVELTNIAGESINLNLVRFTRGIEYTFPSVELPPGTYCLIVKDVAAFEAKYGSKLPVAGQYTGSLSNAGERLELVDAASRVIQSFTYSDDWYGSTDGSGYSLTVKAPKTSDEDSLNEEGAWRPSPTVGGSPGAP